MYRNIFCMSATMLSMLYFLHQLIHTVCGSSQHVPEVRGLVLQFWLKHEHEKPQFPQLYKMKIIAPNSMRYREC